MNLYKKINIFKYLKSRKKTILGDHYAYFYKLKSKYCYDI